MRKLFFLAALSFSLAAHAQATPDANVNVNPDALDPAAKARLRVEGAAGGTGARIAPEVRGQATVTNGRQNRHPAHVEDPALEPPQAGKPVKKPPEK